MDGCSFKALLTGETQQAPRDNVLMEVDNSRGIVSGNWKYIANRLPENLKASGPVFESYGVKIQTIIFTLGRYDLVAIGEAPNAEAITKALLSWSQRGLLRTETLTGFPAEQMIEIVKAI